MAGGKKNELKVTGQASLKAAQAEINTRYDLYKRGLKMVMWRALTLLEASIVQNIRRQFRQRTGTLMNSIAESKQVREEGDKLVGEIGAIGVKYGLIHEEGGLIKPRKAKMLAIPLDPVLGPDGIARSNPLDFKGKSFWYTSAAGSLFLAQPKGKSIELLFLMRNQVQMPARPYLRPALEKNRERIAEKFGLFLESTWNRASGAMKEGD